MSRPDNRVGHSPPPLRQDKQAEVICFDCMAKTLPLNEKFIVVIN